MAHKINPRSAGFMPLMALLASSVFIYLACAGCGSSLSPGGAPAPTGIGPAGGTVISDTCKLIIPPGALTREVDIYISKYNTSNPAVIPGSSYNIVPSGTIFLIPATINISYESITPGTIECEYQLGSFNNNQWLGIGDSTVETTLDFVTGETNSLSIYGIVTAGATTVASIEINLTTYSTKMAYGSYYQLGAIAYPDTGLPLNYVWSSTAPSIVTVNSTGMLHSVTLGIATVNAYAVGKKSPDCTVISGNLETHHIIVRPSAESVYMTGTRQFTAEAQNIDNQTLSWKTFTWYSSNDLIATVDATGLAYGVSEEVCHIFASNEGITGTATLTVVDAPVWTTYVPDSTFYCGQFNSLIIDGADISHISYYDTLYEQLKYVTGEGGNWYPVSVEAATATLESVGEYTSIALDSSGNPHISYHKTIGSVGYLKYASLEANTWKMETVEAGGDVGEFSSIKLNASNDPRISYYDAIHKDLRFAYKNGSGTWTKEVADHPFISADVGRYSSLALDASGNPRISYYDATNKDLKYAWKDGTGWHVDSPLPDSAGDVGMYSSLVIDASGYPHISYYDNTNSSLKYAWKDGTGWHRETVDSSGNVGQFSSIKLDGAGDPKISYYHSIDSTHGNLKYAWRFNGRWYTMIVDGTQDVGRYSSLDLDSFDRPRISYFENWPNSFLKYAEGN